MRRPRNVVSPHYNITISYKTFFVHSLSLFATCTAGASEQENRDASYSILYSFSFLDPVDNPDTVHRIYTCTSFGPDCGNLPANTSSLSSQSAGVPAPVNGTYQIGFWPSAPGSSVSTSLATLTNQFRQYLSGGFGSVNHPTILFASYGSISVGLYVGPGLQS